MYLNHKERKKEKKKTNKQIFWPKRNLGIFMTGSPVIVIIKHICKTVMLLIIQDNTARHKHL